MHPPASSPGKEMVDYICHYLTHVRERRVSPDVQPGYMRGLLPDGAPVEPDSWESIFKDIERIIMPGMVHWQSPHMHAYFPALTSWPSLLGDMLADAINCLGFTWASSPACTELEMNVMDWLAQMMGLPEMFLHYHPDSRGGGILQVCATLGTTGVCAFDNLSELGPISAIVFYLQHWQIPLSRRFRALKLWFVIRSFGVKKLQEHVRHGPNWMTEKVLKDLNKSGKLFVIPATIQEKFIIRFTVTSQFTTREDIQRNPSFKSSLAWRGSKEAASNLVPSRCSELQLPSDLVSIANCGESWEL
uniref:Histidine decarboxylase n=1 Tax=Varanus komodoensis TaxID=61221 RepID=A0A8D2Q8K3_VARKO